MIKFISSKNRHTNLQTSTKLVVDLTIFESKSSNDLFYFYSLTNIEGVYYYGARATKDLYDHKAGYIWASRPSVMNLHFGTNFVSNLFINNCGGYTMKVEDLQKILPEEYEIAFQTLCGEPDYFVRLKGEV